MLESALSAKLPQVMVHMLVHSRTPLLGAHRAEERMRMPGALRLSALVKLPDLLSKLLLLSQKVPAV